MPDTQQSKLFRSILDNINDVIYVVFYATIYVHPKYGGGDHVVVGKYDCQFSSTEDADDFIMESGRGRDLPNTTFTIMKYAPIPAMLEDCFPPF